jgi:hypothetical protein
MPNKITIYLGESGALGTIELEVPGMNDLYPVNANIAPNAGGRRVEPGEYFLDSIAYTPKSSEVQTAYGEAIIRFVADDGNKLAIFGGEPAPDGGLAPTEGNSIRVGNDVLGTIVDYIEEGGRTAMLMVTDDNPGFINSIRSNKWHGRSANTEQINLIRPRLLQDEAVEEALYIDNSLDDSDLTGRLIWELLYNLFNEAAGQTDLYQTYDDGGSGFEGAASEGADIFAPQEQIPATGDEQSDDPEEPPYIADPFGDTIRQIPAFDYQSESSGDTETETDDTSAPPDIEDAPDNNY